MRRIVYAFAFISLSHSSFAQSAGSYYGSTGKGHCKIKIRTDHSYEQEVTDCLYSFITTGTAHVNNDTLTLFPAKTYHYNQDRKKTLVTDTNYVSIRLTKYIVRPDSLIQLKKYDSGYHRTWTLQKTKPKK